MIINENNKNSILKGQMKRGFNQTPQELNERIMNQNIQNNKIKKDPEPVKQKNTYSQPKNFKSVLHNLKRF